MEHLFARCVFPALRMDEWIGRILSSLDPGEVTTFGAIASALGERRAARAVGEVLSGMDVPGRHRVIHSDGTVPPGALEPLRAEIDLSRPIDRGRYVLFELEDPPFPVLSAIQLSMGSVRATAPRPGPDIAGMDVSSDRMRTAASFCLTDPKGSPIGAVSLQGDLPFPYVPGHLFYREAPLLLPLIHRARDEGLMDETPLVLVDGNGRLHPRRMGIACQIGAIGLLPTCGVAKRLLLGRVGAFTGDQVMEAPVVDGGEVLGTAVRRAGRRPFYVSEGCGPDLRTCVQRVRDCLISSRPEPLVMAHRSSNEARRGAQKP